MESCSTLGLGGKGYAIKAPQIFFPCKTFPSISSSPCPQSQPFLTLYVVVLSVTYPLLCMSIIPRWVGCVRTSKATHIISNSDLILHQMTMLQLLWILTQEMPSNCGLEKNFPRTKDNSNVTPAKSSLVKPLLKNHQLC